MDRPPFPSEPEAFFSDYLPRFFAESGETFGHVTSVGSVTIRVEPAGEWSLRLRDGELEVTRGQEDDVVIQVTTPAEDFTALLAEMAMQARPAAQRSGSRKGPLGALLADAETSRLVRHVPGSLLFVARDGEARRRVLFTPGRRAARLDSADCTIECSLEDLRDPGKTGVTPLALFASGKLKITGNIQIAMALSAVLA
jgi:hypothetical protein